MNEVIIYAGSNRKQLILSLWRRSFSYLTFSIAIFLKTGKERKHEH